MTPCRIFFPTYNTLPHNGNVLLPVRNELSFYIGARSKIYRLIALQHVVVSYLVYPFRNNQIRSMLSWFLERVRIHKISKGWVIATPSSNSTEYCPGPGNLNSTVESFKM